MTETSPEGDSSRDHPEQLRHSSTTAAIVGARSQNRVQVNSTLTVTTTDYLANSRYGSLTTPKKKWMQLWSAQIGQTEAEVLDATQGAPSSSAVNLAQLAPRDTAKDIAEQVRGSTVDRGEDLKEAEPPVAEDEVAEDGEILSDTETGHATHVNSLRVTMPAVAGPSTLSPSGEPSAASTTISPSAKLKETDVNQTRTPSPARVLTKAASTSQLLESKQSSFNHHDKNIITNTVAAAQESALSKRKVFGDSTDGEEELIELTPSELLRLERRRAKKSKWDEGDPRKHGGSLDLAALNLLSSTNTPASHPASFAKFPRNRPAFRQSQSLDSKEPPYRYRSNFRATVQAALQSMSPPGSQQSATGLRRPLTHAASLPIDRSRPPLRPSSRYPPTHGDH